ncbi:MAG: LarC family nickel insertion protein [Anaerolineales bacterium]
MTRIAYFDCFSGASGDMLLGALLDAGASVDTLRTELGKLPVSGYALDVEHIVSQGVSGTRLVVRDLAKEQPVRNLSLIRSLLQAADLPANVAERSLAVFERIAAAEARVHGTTIDEIHFHEIGAVDSLIDIVGFFVALADLGIEQIYSSGLPLGSGTVHTAHGLLPVPAPATLALLAEKSAPIVPFDAHAELVTPTGAALLTSVATFALPPMRVQAVGYGFGQKQFAWPNLLRVWLGELEQEPHRPHDPTRGSEHTHGHDHGPSHEHGHPHEHAHPHSASDDAADTPHEP